ncbi:hypothetical protein ABZ749_18205, partial [Micromonospora sp. NPDC047753]
MTVAASRLFLLPPAGGSAGVFRGWDDRLGELLGDALSVVAPELPGRGARIAERPPPEVDGYVRDLDQYWRTMLVMLPALRGVSPNERPSRRMYAHLRSSSHGTWSDGP